MANRKASPDMGSGLNPNTPVRLYDTHPNRRIAVGEEVVMIDHEQPNVRGLVLGYCAEDRLWVKWPTVVAQEDVHDVMAMGELGNVLSSKDTGVVTRPQSVHTPGAFPKKTASRRKGARLSFKKVQSGNSHAFDVFVEGKQLGTVRQKVKGGKRLWKVSGRKNEKLFATRKEAAESLCTGKKCAKPKVVKAHQNAHLARKDGVRVLGKAEKALRKAGKKREADLTARVAKTAMILHLMHYVPGTRREASSQFMGNLWRNRVRLALRMTNRLRKGDKGRFASIADSIEIAIKKAFTYPRVSLTAAITAPPTAFNMTFGANAYQAWDEVLRRAQQRGIDPMMANYGDVSDIMGQVQQEMQGGAQVGQAPVSQMDPQQMTNPQQNLWFQQQQSIGNPRVPAAAPAQQPGYAPGLGTSVV